MIKAITAMATLIAQTTAIKALQAPPQEDLDDEPENGITFPEGKEDLIKIHPSNYPASFHLSNEIGGHCSATMISPRMALTAAHCIFKYWNTPIPSNVTPRVTLTNSDPDVSAETFNVV